MVEQSRWAEWPNPTPVSYVLMNEITVVVGNKRHWRDWLQSPERWNHPKDLRSMSGCAPSFHDMAGSRISVRLSDRYWAKAKEQVRWFVTMVTSYTAWWSAIKHISKSLTFPAKIINVGKWFIYFFTKQFEKDIWFEGQIHKMFKNRGNNAKYKLCS